MVSFCQVVVFITTLTKRDASVTIRKIFNKNYGRIMHENEQDYKSWKKSTIPTIWHKSCHELTPPKDHILGKITVIVRTTDSRHISIDSRCISDDYSSFSKFYGSETKTQVPSSNNISSDLTTASDLGDIISIANKYCISRGSDPIPAIVVEDIYKTFGYELPKPKEVPSLRTLCARSIINNADEKSFVEMVTGTGDYKNNLPDNVRSHLATAMYRRNDSTLLFGGK